MTRPPAWTLAAGFLALAAAPLRASAPPLPVFDHGVVRMPVVVGGHASPEERAAAADLARVLGRMSGLDWPVQKEGWLTRHGFFVGRTRSVQKHGGAPRPSADPLAPGAGQIGPDGFRIWSEGRRVYLVGATSEATVFAVAWFLQHEGGARWYAPGALGEVVPARPAWSLPAIDETVQPAYGSREIYGLSSPEELEWARHNGLRGRLEFSHALSSVFPTEVLGVHPDWEPLIRGERVSLHAGKDGQPNLALRDVAAYAARAAENAFAEEPGRPSFSLAVNDSVRFDQGPETRALVEPLRYFRGRPDYSPLVFTFMNRAADGVSGGYPDRYLGCLAYFWCENAPGFAVRPSVLPYLTADRSQYYDASYRREDAELMSRWGRSGVRAFGLWDYAYGEGFVIPREPVGALAESLRTGWRLGARGYFAEMGPQWGFDALKAWVLTQLLWDPERPLGLLKDDFFAGYFGEAAGPMRRFFDACESLWMAQSGSPFWLKLYRQEDQALVFTEAECSRLGALLEEARKAAVGPAAAERVRQTSRAFAVTEAYAAFDSVRRQLGSLPDASGTPAESDDRLSTGIRRLAEAEERLESAAREAQDVAPGALRGVDLAPLTRDDPVPRLLWLAGQEDPARPRRILDRAGSQGTSRPAWKAMADCFEPGGAGTTPNLVSNARFAETSPSPMEPVFLYPRFGPQPAAWALRAMPTESGRVSLEGAGPASHVLRIEGAWDTQLYQWFAAGRGLDYQASARVRGRSSPAADTALFLTFLTADGKVAGDRQMQCLPKGVCGDHSLALAGRAPTEAAWVGVGIGASRQSPGDWSEVLSVDLRASRTEEAP